jgi:virulence-associated protein VapD
MKRILLLIIVLSILTGCTPKDITDNDNRNGEIPTEESSVPEPSISAYIDTDSMSRQFGFTNEDGSLIITTEAQPEVENLKKMNKAIGENGNILDIKYLRQQKRNEKDNGRLTSQNFDNLEGYVYEVMQGKASGNETYYLVDSSEFNTAAVLEAQMGSLEEAALETKAEIERIKNRIIKSSWEIGRIDSDISIYLVLFERKEDDMLASIVMKTPEKLVFKDYPAVYNEMSTWRVDDGGSIYPDMFSILFAAKAEEGIILGINWRAFEGENTVLFKENNMEFEALNIEASRYMSPL